MAPRLLLLLLLLLPLLHLVGPALAEVPGHYSVRYARPGALANAAAAQEYLDPTYPLPSPPPMVPTCTVPVLSYSFANTYGAAPATAFYAPPSGCPAPWSQVVLSFSVEISGDQYDRVAAVWLDGAELLRTTTAEPTPEGIRWTVRKDVTRYSALLRSPPRGVLSVMLENLVNDVFTGLYNVTVSLEFHGTPPYRLSEVTSSSSDKKTKLPESYFQAPADLILPISEACGDLGYWFRIQNSSDERSRLVTIPTSAYRAVLEVFVSPHSDDEFWYSNPPDIYIQENNLNTGRGNAAYREVVVSVDGRFAGSFVPFPVIYTGGINPLYWQPVSALGAFDLPTYDIELTPFIGLLIDRSRAHEIGISVVDGIAEWLVDANLHLWLDPSWVEVDASLGPYQTPRLSISRKYTTQQLNGSFSIGAKRESFFSGWVVSSLGNLTTEVETELEAKSLVEFTNDGSNKTVQQKLEQETEVVVRSAKGNEIGKLKTETEYPLSFYMDTEDRDDGTSVVNGSLSHTLDIQTEVECGDFESETQLVDEQTAEGWMLVKDHDVIDGSAKTSQKYSYEDDQWEYQWSINAADGVVVSEKYSAPDDDLQAAASAGGRATD